MSSQSYFTTEMNVIKALVVLSIVAACFVFRGEARCYREDKFEKVKVSLYYEAMCGGCKAVMSSFIYPTYKAIPDIMELELVPFGNGFMNETITRCQHGERECFLNTLQSCTLHHYDFDQALEYIHCMEKEHILSDELIGTCAEENKIDFKKIFGCAMRDEGRQLLKAMYDKTKSLNPPHKYVPWLTFNGEHTDKMQDDSLKNMLKYVCDLYKGPKPQACETA